jgi:anti-anti-sigma factor
MNINEFQYKEYKVVDIEGSLDLYNVGELKDILNEYLEIKIKKIIIRFSENSFIDSSGIALLLTMNNKLEKMGERLHLILQNQKLNQIFEILSVDQKIKKYKTVEDVTG